jgi:hypothetical protein
MNEYLAGMIARSEHQEMKQSLRTVSDFDMRGKKQQPNRAVKHIGRLFQSIGSTLTSVQERMTQRQPTQKPVARRVPQADNC